MKRLRGGASLLVLGALLFVASPFLHPATEDSFAASWLAASSGAESVTASRHLSIWHGRSGAVAPEPAYVLLVARLGGQALADTSFAATIAAIALAWGLAASRLARALGATWLLGRLVVLAGALGVLAVAGGRWSVLAAAPLAWIVAELVTARRTTPTILAVIALAMLSQGGLALATVGLAGAALWYGATRGESVGGLWLGAGLALAAMLAFDEPGWAHVLRFSSPHAFAPSGAWSAESSRLPFVWRLFGDDAPGSLTALLLFLGAALGATRVAGSRAVVMGAIALLALRLAAPHRFLTLLLPPALFHPVTAIASAAAIVVLVALFALASRRTIVAGIAIAALSVVFLGRAWRVEPSAIVPSSFDSVVEARVGRGLVLPTSPADDFAWRRASGGAEPVVVNGLQLVLDRNPALLRTELPTLDRDDLAKALGRLDLDWALTDRGIVFARDGKRLQKREPCLSTNGWALTATRGHPDVSIPERAVDGDPRTRWGTGGPQKPGDSFVVELPAARELASLEIDYSSFRADRPRGFRILLAGTDGELRPWLARDPYIGEVTWSESGFPHFESDRKLRIRVPLGGRVVKKLAIELTRPARRVDWSIGELCLRPEPEDVSQMAAARSP